MCSIGRPYIHNSPASISSGIPDMSQTAQFIEYRINGGKYFSICDCGHTGMVKTVYEKPSLVVRFGALQRWKRMVLLPYRAHIRILEHCSTRPRPLHRGCSSNILWATKASGGGVPMCDVSNHWLIKGCQGKAAPICSKTQKRERRWPAKTVGVIPQGIPQPWRSHLLLRFRNLIVLVSCKMCAYGEDAEDIWHPWTTQLRAAIRTRQ